MINTATKMKNTANDLAAINKNTIGFRRDKIFLPVSSNDKVGIAAAMTVTAELMQFGFIADPSAVQMMVATDLNNLSIFHTQVIEYLKDITGTKHDYKPFWKGFPEEVMEKSEMELWIHQIVHYLSVGSYIPDEWTKARPTAFEQPTYRTYKAGTEDEFSNIFTELVSVNQSLTPQDLGEVKWFAANYGSELKMPSKVPFKETLAVLAAMEIRVPVKTPTDVLRIAVAMSGGDTSLPKVPAKTKNASAWVKTQVPNKERENFKFRKFTRAERRYILGLLEDSNCSAEDAVLKEGRWVRLGEILHPAEYGRRFPKSAALFNKIRNENVVSWYGTLQKEFTKDFNGGVKFLSIRAGEFVRRLDWMVRTTTGADQKNVLDTFESIGAKVSNKVLFETFAHFEGRTKPVQNRTIMVKGARSRTKLPDLPALPVTLVESMQSTIKDILSTKFAALGALGDVWVDPELKNIPVPTNMRSMSDAMRPRVRGQRTPIGNQKAKVVRAYVHWFDEYGTEDIDLTATLIGMGKSMCIGWDGMHNYNGEKDNISCYSGDIRHMRGACAEYIDINFANALKDGYKYAIVDARDYQGRGFHNIKDSAFGYEEREFPTSNELFKPSTLANAIKLQSTSTTIIVAVIDLETQEYIFLDIDQKGIPVASANFDAIMEAIKPYCEPPTFSIFDLIMMHVEKRGNLITDPTKATTKFEYAPFADSYIETLKLMQV